MVKGTHRLESGDIRGFVVRGDVVDYHPSIGRTQVLICELGNALICPVSSAEVEDCGSVVGENFGEGAGCAGCVLGDVMAGIHGCVECVLGGLERWMEWRGEEDVADNLGFARIGKR
jgi:hypothetical protein